ncbi:MAG: hypothetical protein KJ587_04510 [Alphaproteobacteria bacterium]|nr:hypothetical protein [Alphaproteobacteria bacterium]
MKELSLKLVDGMSAEHRRCQPPQTERFNSRFAGNTERFNAELDVSQASSSSIKAVRQLNERVAVWENEGGAICDISR